MAKSASTRLNACLRKHGRSLLAAFKATNQITYHLVALPHSHAAAMRILGPPGLHSSTLRGTVKRCTEERGRGEEDKRIATKYNKYEMIYRQQDRRPALATRTEHEAAEAIRWRRFVPYCRSFVAGNKRNRKRGYERTTRRRLTDTRRVESDTEESASTLYLYFGKYIGKSVNARVLLVEFNFLSLRVTQRYFSCHKYSIN